MKGSMTPNLENASLCILKPSIDYFLDENHILKKKRCKSDSKQETPIQNTQRDYSNDLEDTKQKSSSFNQRKNYHKWYLSPSKWVDTTKSKIA